MVLYRQSSLYHRVDQCVMGHIIFHCLACKPQQTDTEASNLHFIKWIGRNQFDKPRVLELYMKAMRRRQLLSSNEVMNFTSFHLSFSKLTFEEQFLGSSTQSLGSGELRLPNQSPSTRKTSWFKLYIHILFFPISPLPDTAHRKKVHRSGHLLILILSLPQFLQGFEHYSRLAGGLQGEGRCTV